AGPGRAARQGGARVLRPQAIGELGVDETVVVDGSGDPARLDRPLHGLVRAAREAARLAAAGVGPERHAVRLGRARGWRLATHFAPPLASAPAGSAATRGRGPLEGPRTFFAPPAVASRR